MYQKGDKFKVNIEGEERHCNNIDDVFDFVSDKTYFEVDEQALRTDLKYISKHQTIKLRHDCVIWCIA